MAKIARRRLARELVRLFDEQPGRKAELLRQTAAYLIQTKQAHEAHLLLSDIAEELLQSKDHLSAEVQSAFQLSDATRQQVIDLLKSQTGAKSVELSETEVPELLGGVVIRTPRLQWDASVRRQLTQLASPDTVMPDLIRHPVNNNPGFRVEPGMTGKT